MKSKTNEAQVKILSENLTQSTLALPCLANISFPLTPDADHRLIAFN